MILKELLTLFISIKYLDEFGSLSRRNYFRTRKSRRQNFNSTAPCQTVRALLRHTAYQCELNFRKDLNVVIQLIWRMHIERTFLFSD